MKTQVVYFSEGDGFAQIVSASALACHSFTLSFVSACIQVKWQRVIGPDSAVRAIHQDEILLMSSRLVKIHVLDVLPIH